MVSEKKGLKQDFEAPTMDAGERQQEAAANIEFGCWAAGCGRTLWPDRPCLQVRIMQISKDTQSENRFEQLINNADRLDLFISPGR